MTGDLEKLKKQLERIEAEPSDEEIWRSVELARHSATPVHARLRRPSLRGLRRASRRPRPRRGPRPRNRAWPIPRADGRDHRPAEGPGAQRAHQAQLRHGPSRGLPEGHAHDGDRPAARIPARHVPRLARRVSGRGSRAARSGWGDRPLAGAHGAADGAAGRVHHRRGQLGRRNRDRARRPRADAGERDLQRHLARGLRGDPVARRRREGQGCRRRSSPTRCTASSSASSTRSSTSRKAARTSIPTRPRGRSARLSARPWRSCRRSRARSFVNNVARDTAAQASTARVPRNRLSSPDPEVLPQAELVGYPHHPQCFPPALNAPRPAKSRPQTLTPWCGMSFSGRIRPVSTLYVSGSPDLKHR